MEEDLLIDLHHLDLHHLDDPEPPPFDALRAEEAMRRSARDASHRARAVGGVALAVTLLAGIGVAALGRSGDAGGREAAEPQAVTMPALPDDTATAATATADAAGGREASGRRTSDPEPVLRLPAPSVTTTTATPGTAGSGGPTTTRVPTTPPTKPAPAAVATGQSPPGTAPAPADLRFTLTLETSKIAAGGRTAAHIRFENLRSTPVTLVGGGCSLWTANLYEAGRSVTTSPGHLCPMAIRRVVEPGAVVEGGATLQTGPDLRPGTYDAFTMIRVEGVHPVLHTDRLVVEVVRS